ncbi:MAG: hypothetical protein AAFP67_09585 [Pseudomonadota bacterium]
MSSQTLPTIFADSIADMQVTNGNLRVTLVQAGKADGETVECARLVLPANRAHPIAKALVKGIEELASKMREQQETAGIPPEQQN